MRSDGRNSKQHDVIAKTQEEGQMSSVYQLLPREAAPGTRILQSIFTTIIFAMMVLYDFLSLLRQYDALRMHVTLINQ